MLTFNAAKKIAAYATIVMVSTSCAQHSGYSQQTPASAAGTSAYAGQQLRSIKSLSAKEIDNLQSGAGMGYAKAAELNGYPGPLHVLELATPLQLSNEQRSASEDLMAQHKAKARVMGQQLIDAEAALDTAFSSKQIDAMRIAALTGRIGSLQAALRAEHLQTHLQQTALLSTVQIANYQRLRGYDNPNTNHQQHSH